MISTRSRLLILLIILMGVIISCDLEVPIKKMTQARAALTKARLVMADKYEPDNLNKSQEQLYKCHDFLKMKDTANAKKAAEASRDYAVKAITASLPRAAEDTLAEARTGYQEADKLYAEHFAQEQFTRAGNTINDAEKLKSEKNLLDSFLKSKDAIAAANEAKEICLKKVPQLNEAIDKMKLEIDDLNKQSLGDTLNHELAAVSAKLDKADLLIVQNDVKQAAPLISEAENGLNKITGSLKKSTVKDRIMRLRQDVENMKKERGSDAVGEDIVGVVSMLNEADSLLEQDKVDDALNKIAEAEKSLEMAKDKTMKTTVVAKLESVGRLLEAAKKKDTQNKLQNEISEASQLYIEGKDLLVSEHYKESLAKLTEAESLLNSLGVALEKDQLTKEGALKSLEGKRVYKVIYNRANRDCLWRIAQKVYKKARLWPLIYAANRDQIKDPDLIFPGQTFIIPEIPAKRDIEPKEQKDDKDVGTNKPEDKKNKNVEIDIKAREE